MISSLQLHMLIQCYVPQRLNIEASPDELQQMEQYFTNTVQHPMEEHCCLIINTLDDIIVNKLNCASCIRDGMKKISDTHCSHELFNNSDLYKVSRKSIHFIASKFRNIY